MSKCGPSLLPPKLSLINTSPPPSAAECELHLIQRGYAPQDVEACSQLRSSLEAAGEAGLDFRDLCEAHSSLEEPRSGRTRNLLQYMKVSSSARDTMRSFQHECSTAQPNCKPRCFNFKWKKKRIFVLAFGALSVPDKSVLSVL